ncbi:nuclear transport factor 2 family protein [Flavisphingomonas formosensis]|uniref:nuclear transport factor 2 family protein n=1 Tax=Flavisphingomonas formosensis TaxID=861534 RepID=UPI0012FCD3B9|nr:nuclear transport factor 2 family protein [Sphingomonas formosensis]
MADPTPLEQIRDAYAQWHESKAGSIDVFLKLLAPHFKMRSVLGNQIPDPLALDRKGIDQAREYLDLLTRDWEMIEMPTEQVLSDGDTVVWIGRCQWRNRATGDEVKCPKVDVWRFAEGKAVQFLEMFDSLGFAKAARLA